MLDTEKSVRKGRAAVAGHGIGGARSSEERQHMHDQLSDSARETALHAARTMFPHDGFPDEAYEKVIRQIEVEAANNEDVAKQIEEGIAALDGSGSFASLDEDARLEALTKAEGTPFFALLKATAVVELYDNPAVWKLLGYEGPAAHLGGYVDRGFDDLDWLPDPPLVMSAEAGSHHQ
jgi:hypothetical protein